MGNPRPGTVEYEERNLMSVVAILEGRLASMAGSVRLKDRNRREEQCRDELRRARAQLEELRGRRRSLLPGHDTHIHYT